jgi:hypothetical protein
MERSTLKESFEGKSGLTVVAELTGGPNFNFAPIEKFLEDYKAAGGSAMPGGFDFAGITLPQSPGGLANIKPADEGPQRLRHSQSACGLSKLGRPEHPGDDRGQAAGRQRRV